MTREEAKLVLDSLATWEGEERMITAEHVEAIRALSQEPCLPNDLEEASSKFATHTASNGVSVEFLEEKLSFQEGAKWQKEQDDKELSDLLTIAHLQGAEQMKEQMMKDAVEGKIAERIQGKLYARCQVPETMKAEFGDKVRIIIVKEDEK